MSTGTDSVADTGDFKFGAIAAAANELTVTWARRVLCFAAVHRPTGLVIVAGWVAQPS